MGIGFGLSKYSCNFVQILGKGECNTSAIMRASFELSKIHKLRGLFCITFGMNAPNIDLLVCTTYVHHILSCIF